MDVTQLALTWVGRPNGEKVRRLACKFDLDQSERKSSQVNAIARKPNEVASRPKFSTCVYLRLRLPRALIFIIIWLVPRAGKMNQIACCDWLPERARWSHLARSGLPAVSRKQNFTKSHIINPLLTKFVRSRWLDIGLVLFLRVYGPRLRLGP